MELVYVKLWVDHERHGFDYNDEYSVTLSIEECSKIQRSSH